MRRRVEGLSDALENDVVRLGEEFPHLPVTDLQLGLERGFATGSGVQHPDSKASEAARNRFTDPSQTDDPNGGAVKVLAREEVKAPLPPVPAPNQILALRNPPEAGEEKRHGGIGGGLGQDIRGVSHGDSPGGARCNIDVVDSHRHLGDHAQTRGRVQEHRVDLIDQHA